MTGTLYSLGQFESGLGSGRTAATCCGAGTHPHGSPALGRWRNSSRAMDDIARLEVVDTP